MRQQIKPSEKKQAVQNMYYDPQNLSFDLMYVSNQPCGYNVCRLIDTTAFSTKNGQSLFPKTTQNASKEMNKKQPLTQPTISPNNFKISDSLSPQRRLFSSKRGQETAKLSQIPTIKPIKNQSLSSSKNLALTQTKRTSQHQKKENLTIRTGQSIEAMKEFLSPIQQQVLSTTNQFHGQKTSNQQVKYLLQNTEKYSTQKIQPGIDIRSRRKLLNMSDFDNSQTNDGKTKQSQKLYINESSSENNTGVSFIQSQPRGYSQHDRQNSKDLKIWDQKSPFNYHKKNQSFQLGPKIEDSSLLLQISTQHNTHNVSESIKSIPKVSWSEQKLPLTPQSVLDKFSPYLSELEKSEIMDFKKIYCIGMDAKKSDYTSKFNDGYDDVNGEYLYVDRDHIGFRYEILEPLGKGSFGQVLKVLDHKKQSLCAIKIIKNKKKFQNQALVELNILTFIKEKDEENLTNVVKISDFVIFRNHVCIAFELLSMNLYELIKSNNYQGLSLELIRRFAIQILNALNFLHKQKIVHCDLKPENILLKQANKSGIKIVDFGSSCFEHERVYSYIQSRYYRSPEVILGLPYEMGIDMWSFGCIMAELYMGYPLYPGENEQEQMAYIMEIIGQPSDSYIENCPRKKYFFSPSPYIALPFTNSRGKTRLPLTKELKHVMGCNDVQFIDFLQRCFVWESEKRLKPLQALMHNWILEGLPLDIRVQHIKYLESEQLSQKILVKPTRKQDVTKSINQGDQGQQHSLNQSEKNSEPQPEDNLGFGKHVKSNAKDRTQDYSLEKPKNNPQDRPRNPTTDKAVNRSIEKSKPLDAQNALLNLLKSNYDDTPKQKKLNSLYMTTGKAHNSFNFQQRLPNFPTTTKSDTRSKFYNK